MAFEEEQLHKVDQGSVWSMISPVPVKIHKSSFNGYKLNAIKHTFLRKRRRNEPPFIFKIFDFRRVVAKNSIHIRKNDRLNNIRTKNRKIIKTFPQASNEKSLNY